MTDNKKKLNITVKKTTSPFLFPDSNQNKEKDSIVYVQTQSPVVTNVTTIATVSSNTPVTAVPVSTAEPEKRKRGRPRLNKDAAPTVKESKSAKTALQGAPSTVNGVESLTLATTSTLDSEEEKSAGLSDTNINSNIETESEKILKKRGRKPKSQNPTVSVSDRIYGLNNTKNSMDLENLENLSYIVNLKITKEKVEEIINEINEEIEQSNTLSVRMPVPSVIPVSSAVANLTLPFAASFTPNLTPSIANRKASVEIGASTNSLSTYGGTQDLTGSVVKEVVETSKCSTCTKCPHCNLDINGMTTSGNANNNVVPGHKSLQLSNYDQIDVDMNELGQGYLDCYIGDLMPGFIQKDEGGCDRWPLTSKYPCRNCEEMFTTTPAGLIQKIFGDYEVDPMKCKFFLYLNFCNWACAARYAFDRMPDWVNQHNMINLCYNTIMKKVDPKHAWRKVDMAPELGNLQRNGGELSIEQYRNLTQTNITYTIYLAPLIPLKMTLEETSNTNSTRVAKNRTTGTNTKEKVVLLDKTRVMKAEQSIKSRKEGNKGNTIDRLMKVEIR